MIIQILICKSPDFISFCLIAVRILQRQEEEKKGLVSHEILAARLEKIHLQDKIFAF
jgi:hypothetical protein